VLLLFGLVLILSARSIVMNAGDRTIRNNGGTMDTSQFERIVDETTASYRMTGLVISLVVDMLFIKKFRILHRFKFILEVLQMKQFEYKTIFIIHGLHQMKPF